jgi:hypothetical protein
MITEMSSDDRIVFIVFIVFLWALPYNFATAFCHFLYKHWFRLFLWIILSTISFIAYWIFLDIISSKNTAYLTFSQLLDIWGIVRYFREITGITGYFMGGQAILWVSVFYKVWNYEERNPWMYVSFIAFIFTLVIGLLSLNYFYVFFDNPGFFSFMH